MTQSLLDGSFRLGVGIEDTFIANVSPGRRALDEYELTQHYDNWQTDLDLVRESGAQLLRYGFPWYRLNPAPGKFEWEWADCVVDKLASLDVVVIVDLVHYGTPLWLDNQFLNRNYPQAVADYAYALAERYGDRLKTWTPLNEPQWTARLCGESATWPPELSGHGGYLQVMLAICHGIVLSQQAVRAAVRSAEIVHVEASFRYDATPTADGREARLLADRRFLATDLVTGRVDAEHPLAGYLAENGVHDHELEWFQLNRAIPDVLGMNYYPMWSTLEYSNQGEATVATERDDGVVGLADVLRTAAARYGVPVMLTETSFEGSVEDRLNWLAESVAAVRDLRDEVDVVGYTWWPFFDQIRWQYREALTPVTDHLHHLGLVALDPDEIGRLHRRPTALLDAFRALVSSHPTTNHVLKEAST